MLLFILNLFVRVVRFYSMLLIVYALISWFPGAYQSGFGRFVIRLVRPILQPFSRLNLRFAGLDFTVVVAMLALNLLTEFGVRLILLFLS